jgi:hypothetical protein
MQSRFFHRLKRNAVLVWVLSTSMAPRVVAQAVPSATPTAPTNGPIDSALALPPLRALAMPPAVPQTGALLRRDGTAASIPTTATFALADVRLYREQFRWVFPMSGERYPADSIQHAVGQRASAWLDRLRRLTMLDPPAVSGWQLVSFAEAAARAGEDTLARRLFETRLAQLAPSAAERAYVLLEAVRTFADTARDSTQLARTVPWAEQYASALHAMPAGGYATENDSTSVLYGQLIAEHALLLAYDALHQPRQLLQHVDRLFAVAQPIAAPERGSAIADHFPYLIIYRALFIMPDSEARWQAMDTRIVAAHLPSANTIVQMMALIGRPAPPVPVHVIARTADSLYHATPIDVSLVNGRIHVLGFGRYDNLVPYVLQRVQRHFPTDVDVTFVTHSQGYVGVDLFSPPDEAAWLASYLTVDRHVTLPVAIWAPAKVAVNGGMIPPPWPEDDTYHANGLSYSAMCVLVDNQGIVRGYYDLRSRKEEAALERDITRCLAHPAMGATPVIVP